MSQPSEGQMVNLCLQIGAVSCKLMILMEIRHAVCKLEPQ